MRRAPVSLICAAILLLILQNLSAQFPAQHIFSVAYNGQTVQMTDSTFSNVTCDCYGLEIWASNFTLDGAGNKLRGGGIPADRDADFIGLGVKPLNILSNVTVKNLEVTAWGHGVYGRNWSYGVLDSCWVHDNEINGYQSGQTDNTEIEISYSTFERNGGNGIKISDASYYSVHHNSIISNGDGGIEILRDGSHHNRIENNQIRNHEGTTEEPGYGLYMHTYYNPDGISGGMPKHNLIRNNLFDNSKVRVEESDSNTFIGNTFEGSASKIEVINCIGNTFYDCYFGGLWGALNLTVQDAEVTFIGTSFDGATLNLSGTAYGLTVGWHVAATVTDEGTPVEGAVVQFYDKDDVLVATDTTNAEGEIDTLGLMEYVRDEIATTYYTPYRYVVLRDGVEFYSSTFDLTENTHLTTTTTAVDGQDTGGLPVRFSLEQNRPNPFNPQTMIEYALDESQNITLTVYSVTGHTIRVLDAGYRLAGPHQVIWDGKDEDGALISSGVYVYRLHGERGDQQWKKAVFLK